MNPVSVASLARAFQIGGAALGLPSLAVLALSLRGVAGPSRAVLT